MTPEERGLALTPLGFTERQSRFLVTAMLHGGVCLGRQYCTFAGIARGKAVRDLFQQLIDRRFATAYPRAHGSTHIYHLHGKELYRTIGEVNNRNRRPVALPRALERIMILDEVIARPEVTWLATEREKVTYFTRVAQLRPEELPHVRFGNELASTVRYFPDKLPIGREPDGRTHTFVYLVTRRLPVDFRAFLHRHAGLLRMLPGWVVRLLFPGHLAGAIPTYHAALRDELATPLQTETVDELRWYFDQRRRGIRGAGLATEARFRRAQEAFSTPRCRVLYRTWLEHGDRALHATLSPVLADAMMRRSGRLDCQVLTHRYQHLATMVGTA